MDTDSQRLIHTETGGQNGGSAVTPPQTKPGRKKPVSAGNASKGKSAQTGTEHAALELVGDGMQHIADVELGLDAEGCSRRDADYR